MLFGLRVVVVNELRGGVRAKRDARTEIKTHHTLLNWARIRRNQDPGTDAGHDSFVLGRDRKMPEVNVFNGQNSKPVTFEFERVPEFAVKTGVVGGLVKRSIQFSERKQ